MFAASCLENKNIFTASHFEKTKESSRLVLGVAQPTFVSFLTIVVRKFLCCVYK